MKMIITPNKFAILIEELVKTKRMSYIDAILHYCEKNGIDPSELRRLIDKPFLLAQPLLVPSNQRVFLIMRLLSP